MKSETYYTIAAVVMILGILYKFRTLPKTIFRKIFKPKIRWGFLDSPSTDSAKNLKRALESTSVSKEELDDALGLTKSERTEKSGKTQE